MITVHVTVGVGFWKAHKTVQLVACPHTDDRIEVGKDGPTVTCERVTITDKAVYVEETIRFTSEQAAKEYFS